MYIAKLIFVSQSESIIQLDSCADTQYTCTCTCRIQARTSLLHTCTVDKQDVM